MFCVAACCPFMFVFTKGYHILAAEMLIMEGRRLR
jgi:hypothetical protein